MINITTTKEKIKNTPQKYVRLVVTEDKPNLGRFVETAEGNLEYHKGAGKWEKMTPRKFITFVRSIVQDVKKHQIEYLSIQLSNSIFPQLNKIYNTNWVLSTITENLLLASYEFTKYKTRDKDDKEKKLKEILICGSLNVGAKKGMTRGLVVGEYVNMARDIANTTAQDLTPSILGKTAKDVVKGTKATVKVLDEKEIKKLKMGALFAVGKGSENATQLIVIEYWGFGKPSKSKMESRKSKVNKKKQPIVLIGKGITYDTGGLNVKPSGSMHDMHLDMSGGSSVIAAVACAAKLKLKKNIIGIIPAAENAISDKAMRAGDIVTSMSGKTIEVVHTDAEGRMVLADALTYANKYNPRVVLDVATLTGAALVALGKHASVIMTKYEKLQQTLQTLGEESGDYVWPLPLWDEYKEHIKSVRADVANIAPDFSRFGGTIEGGTFLSHFAPEDTPWAHIDIAPRMESIPSDKIAKGSTGEPVRLLVKFLEQY